MTEMKQCLTCASDIHSNAKKCVECGSFQDFRRYLSIGNTTLSMLVALMSAITTFSVLMKQYYEIAPYSKNHIYDVSKNEHETVFSFQNAGNRFSVFQGAEITIKKLTGKVVTEAVAVMTPVPLGDSKGSELRFIEPQSEPITYKITTHVYSNQEEFSDEQYFNCEYRFTIAEFRGLVHTDTFVKQCALSHLELN